MKIERERGFFRGDYITNPLNQRVAKLVNGEIKEKYLLKDLTTLLAIYNKDNNLVQRFEYANGKMPINR